MIIVKLIGGLGNQMFQYAFGRKLALTHQTDLKLDIEELSSKIEKDDFTLRNFDLSVFNIQAEIASLAEIKRFQVAKTTKLLHLLSLNSPIRPRNFYLREPHHHFFANALIAPINTYANGYWQTEKYFSSIRKELLDDFKPKQELSEVSKKIATKIIDSNSVSIHVRRGDYVSNAVNFKVHGLCEADYYLRAIDCIAEKVKDPYLFVFSDEPSWFKENIKSNFPVVFVEHNQVENSYEDMILMSMCQHNIIANSSFSWWAAWLNQNENKIVIAPKKWMNDSPKNTKDVIPETWIKL